MTKALLGLQGQAVLSRGRGARARFSNAAPSVPGDARATGPMREVVLTAHQHRFRPAETCLEGSRLADAASLSAHQAVIERLGQGGFLRHIQIGDQVGSDIRSPALLGWMQDEKVDFGILRPDRYVFDGGTAQEFPAVAAVFLRGMSSPARTSSTERAAA